MTLARQLTVRSARALWPLIKSLNTTFERPAKTPSWAPSPLLKSRQKSFPTLGWPRETDSLCPACVKEVRGEILSGRRQLSDLMQGDRHGPGEVRMGVAGERD